MTTAGSLTETGGVPAQITKAKNMTTRTKKKNPEGRGAVDLQEWLDEQAVPYEFVPSVPVAEIDIAKSLDNQARLADPLNEERVQQYAEAMENGSIFPPIICWRDGKQLVIIDGNHRLAAWMLNDWAAVPVWVVNTKDLDTITQLTFEANAHHPAPNSSEERMQHALHMVRLGVPQVEAAARMQVKNTELNSAWRKAEADRRATTLGIKAHIWNPIAASSKTRLNALRSDQIFRKAVEVTHKLNLRSDSVSELVGNLNRLRTNTAQQKFLDEYIKDSSNAGTKPWANEKMKSATWGVNRAARALLTSLRADGVFDDLTPLEREEFARLLKEVSTRAGRAARDLNA